MSGVGGRSHFDIYGLLVLLALCNVEWYALWISFFGVEIVHHGLWLCTNAIETARS